MLIYREGQHRKEATKLQTVVSGKPLTNPPARWSVGTVHWLRNENVPSPDAVRFASDNKNTASLAVVLATVLCKCFCFLYIPLE